MKLLLFLCVFIVAREEIRKAVLGFKVVKIERNARRIILVLVTQLEEISFVGGILSAYHGLHDPGELVLILIELKGFREFVCIDRQNIFASAEQVRKRRHDFRERLPGSLGNEQGHVVFGKFVAFLEERGTVVSK